MTKLFILNRINPNHSYHVVDNISTSDNKESLIKCYEKIEGVYSNVKLLSNQCEIDESILFCEEFYCIETINHISKES